MLSNHPFLFNIDEDILYLIDIIKDFDINPNIGLFLIKWYM